MRKGSEASLHRDVPRDVHRRFVDGLDRVSVPDTQRVECAACIDVSTTLRQIDPLFSASVDL